MALTSCLLCAQVYKLINDFLSKDEGGKRVTPMPLPVGRMCNGLQTRENKATRKELGSLVWR
jgi:hypothetical protein